MAHEVPTGKLRHDTGGAMAVCTVQQASEFARTRKHKPLVTVQMYLSKAFEITRSATIVALRKKTRADSISGGTLCAVESRER